MSEYAEARWRREEIKRKDSMARTFNGETDEHEACGAGWQTISYFRGWTGALNLYSPAEGRYLDHCPAPTPHTETR